MCRPCKLSGCTLGFTVSGTMLPSIWLAKVRKKSTKVLPHIAATSHRSTVRGCLSIDNLATQLSDLTQKAHWDHEVGLFLSAFVTLNSWPMRSTVITRTPTMSASSLSMSEGGSPHCRIPSLIDAAQIKHIGMLSHFTVLHPNWRDSMT